MSVNRRALPAHLLMSAALMALAAIVLLRADAARAQTTMEPQFTREGAGYALNRSQRTQRFAVEAVRLQRTPSLGSLPGQETDRFTRDVIRQAKSRTVVTTTTPNETQIAVQRGLAITRETTRVTPTLAEISTRVGLAALERGLPVANWFFVGFTIGTLTNEYVLRIGLPPSGDAGVAWEESNFTLSNIDWWLEQHHAGDAMTVGVNTNPSITFVAPFDGFVYRWSGHVDKGSSSYRTGDAAIDTPGCASPPPPLNFYGSVYTDPDHEMFMCLPRYWYGPGIFGDLKIYYTSLADLMVGGASPSGSGATLLPQDGPVPFGPGETEDYDTFLRKLQDVLADPEANGVPDHAISDVEQLQTCLDYLAGDPSIATPATGAIDPCGQRVGDSLPNLEDPDAPPVGDTRPAPIDPGPIGGPIQPDPRPRCEAPGGGDIAVVPEVLENESAGDYRACLESLGFSVVVETVAGSEPGVPDAGVAVVTPAPGSAEYTETTTVRVGRTPDAPRGPQADERCRPPGGTETPSDPGAPLSDAPPTINSPTMSPYSSIDASEPTHPPYSVYLRWGEQSATNPSSGWGWRHIKARRGYGSQDEADTVTALSTDAAPILRYASTQQYRFHYRYPVTTPDGILDCVRTVSVEYAPTERSANGELVPKGIVTSFYGLWNPY